MHCLILYHSSFVSSVSEFFSHEPLEWFGPVAYYLVRRLRDSQAKAFPEVSVCSILLCPLANLNFSIAQTRGTQLTNIAICRVFRWDFVCGDSFQIIYFCLRIPQRGHVKVEISISIFTTCAQDSYMIQSSRVIELEVAGERVYTKADDHLSKYCKDNRFLKT